MVFINKSKKSNKILIVDDSEMNRAILSEMLDNEYEIIEAADGGQAIAILQKSSVEISLVLLDIVMPVMDGFEVLAIMNKKRWIQDIPVIMISAETAPSYIDRAYDLGVTDFISRPFDSLVVRRRVVNTIMLYSKQKKLAGLVADQIYEKEKNNSLMINILSHIVEFRNGESGLHILHVQTFTDILLKCLVKKTDKYNLSASDISLISNASALHDIGKISIPEEILNKPGRLTSEEFEVMKTHSLVGASMLDELPFYKDEPLVKVAYEICRWHHERYDGRGYPDGLKGDEIPISAQIVALADVYDALTSERVYKKAFPHETAMNMILNGECGTFNPLLLDCLKDSAENIITELKENSISNHNEKEMKNIANELLRHDELSASERTLRQLEQEQIKYEFFTNVSDEIWFEFTSDPPMLTLSDLGSKKLGLNKVTINPYQNNQINSMFDISTLQGFVNTFQNTTFENPIVNFNFRVLIDGKYKYCKAIGRSMWTSDNSPEYIGAIGKITDITDENV